MVGATLAVVLPMGLVREQGLGNPLPLLHPQPQAEE